MPAPTRLHRDVMIWLIIGTWLIMMVAAIVLTHQRASLRPDTNRWFSFVVKSLPEQNPALTGTPLIVHFVDPNCPCSRVSMSYIDSLDQRYTGRVETLRVTADMTPAAWLPKVPASPAVAIWNNDGELAYVGPYSSGAFCGEGEDLVASVMAQLTRGENPGWLNQEAVGCYCAWPTPAG